ncbi:Trigger factor [Gammaproteobacteria bacterium]
MQVILENLSGLERKLNIVIPAERVEKGVQAKLHKLAATVKIPGFRSGKVPFAMVQQRYGDSVHSDVIENLIRETYIEAVKQEKLDPAGLPRVEIVSAKPKEPFSYSAVFEIYPEIKLADFDQIKIEKAVSELTDADINEMLEKLRKEHVQWKEVIEPARKSQAGDQITVDFTVKALDDPAAETSTEKNIKFVLGGGSMWPDFEKHLYGVSGDEKKKYTLKFPETHVDKELAGKDAEFEVEICKVCEPILPPLDDEFAKKMGIKENGLKGLKEEVHKNMERELQTVLKNSFKHAIMEKLLDSNPIDVPKSLIETELDRLAKNWREHFATHKQKVEKNIPEFPRKDATKQAQRNVSLGLLLSTAIKENKIQVEPQDLRAKVEDLASVYDDASKVIDWYFSDQNRLTEIKSLLLEEKVVDYIASKANVVEKRVDYKEAVAKK